MRFEKDRMGNIKCECGCEMYYPMNVMDIFNDRLMSTYCIEEEKITMYMDMCEDQSQKWGEG